MQIVWDFSELRIGYTREEFRHYVEKYAVWKELGDLLICNPAATPSGLGRPDPAQNFRAYFENVPKDQHAHNGSKGWVTHSLSVAAGFRLRWSLAPRVLKIEPGQWNEAAPLPDTKDADFLFWCSRANWDGSLNGGNLQVTAPDQKPQEFTYGGGRRAVLSCGLPHVLTPINPAATRPYYCLYGQLQEDE